MDKSGAPNNTPAEALYKFWGFTAVIYERGSPLSFILGVISLVPVVLIMVVFTLATLKPTTRISFFCLGMTINFAISYFLKQKIFQQPRPEHPWHLAHRADYGMPSNHAQFMSYFFGAVLFSAIDYAKELRWEKSSAGAAIKAKAEAVKKSGVVAAPKNEDAALPKNSPIASLGLKLTAVPGETLAFTLQPSRKVKYQTMKLYKAKTLNEVMLPNHGKRVLFLFIVTLLVMYSRVHGTFHTVGQVWAGFGFGLAISFIVYRVERVFLAVEYLADASFLTFFEWAHELLVRIAPPS